MVWDRVLNQYKCQFLATIYENFFYWQVLLILARNKKSIFFIVEKEVIQVVSK